MLDSLLLATATLLPLDTAPAPQATLTAEPRHASPLVRRLRVTTDLEFDSISAQMGEQEIPSEFLPQLEIEISVERNLTVRDVPEPVADGESLAAFSRTFETVEGEGMLFVAESGTVRDDREASVASELAGRSVRFERDGAGEPFAPVPPAEADFELPPDLRSDLDARSLLPEEGEEAEPGDSWSVGHEALDAWIDPCGRGLWAWTEDLEDDSWESEPEADGGFRVSFEGWVAEAEGQLARLAFEGTREHTKERPNDLAAVPVTEGPGLERMTETETWNGTFVWDCERGTVRSVEATAEVRSETTLATTEDAEGPAFVSTVLVLGERTLAVETELE